MRKLISERHLVIVLFVAALVMFSLANNATRGMEEQYRAATYQAPAAPESADEQVAEKNSPIPLFPAGYLSK